MAWRGNKHKYVKFDGEYVLKRGLLEEPGSNISVRMSVALKHFTIGLYGELLYSVLFAES
jgi:hypothetical protein